MTAYNNNILKYEDWIIFSNGSQLWDKTIENYKDGIYKYNTKTGQVIKLYNYNAYCLNLDNDNLYFCTSDGLIYMVNINSLEYSWISSIDKADYLIIYNGIIFYRSPNGNNVYKYISRDRKDLIAEYTEKEIQIYNNYIYYVDAQTHQLFKKSIKNTKEEPIKILEEIISDFYVKENKIIYLTDEKIKVFYADTNESKMLKDSICSNFVLNNNKVYAYSLKEASIIEIDIDTKEEVNIIKDTKEIYRLQIFGNNIYYYHTTSNYLYVSTQLYYVDVNNKRQEKLFFKTN